MKTNIDNILTEFSNLHKNLQFTIGKESNNKINYVDIKLVRKSTEFVFNRYRKPITTGTVIHSRSCHPTEHRAAAFHFIHNRVKQYPMSKHQKQKELSIIHQIATENNYRTINPYNNIPIPKNTSHGKNTQKKKWATFLYKGKETRFIIKFLKNTNIKTAFLTCNTIENNITQRQQQNTDGYVISRVYISERKPAIKYT
jgi:hypothetical protein